MFVVCFFFSSRRRHTRSDRDWSSDVCSSDLDPGTEHDGVFVYRTIEDLEAILARSQVVHRAVVIGGGLLGLEAARAMYELGLETIVVEMAQHLMPRQLDPESASKIGRASCRERV